MPVRVLTIFESGPTAAGSAAGRLIAGVRSQNAVLAGIDLDFSPGRDPTEPVRSIPYRYAADLVCLRDVRQTAKAFRPDVIHAFGPLAVRVASTLRPRRLVVSHADRATDPFTRWLVRRSDAAFAHTTAERGRYERFGVSRDHLIELPFAVDSPVTERESARHDIGLTPDDCVLVASGQFDSNAGLRYAVWAFDLLRLVHPEARLVLIGDGPERPRVERFARTLGCDPFVRFVGSRADAARLIASADMAWLTHRDGGLTVAHEALAAGVPVLGFRTADTASLPIPSESLVPYGDPATLSVRTCGRFARPIPSEPRIIPVSTLATIVAGVYDSLVTRRTEG